MGGNRKGLHREEERRRKEMFWYIPELSCFYDQLSQLMTNRSDSDLWTVRSMRQNHVTIIWNNSRKEPQSPVFQMRWINSCPIVFPKLKKNIYLYGV